jgi:hypothetical protein
MSKSIPQRSSADLCATPFIVPPANYGLASHAASDQDEKPFSTSGSIE